MDFYSASSLKQQSVIRHVVPLRHIVLISSQQVFALTPCLLSRIATNTNFKVFGFTQWGLDLTIYHTRGEHANHYITDAVFLTTIYWNPLYYQHIYTKRTYSSSSVVIYRCRFGENSDTRWLENCIYTLTVPKFYKTRVSQEFCQFLACKDLIYTWHHTLWKYNNLTNIFWKRTNTGRIW